MLFGMTMCPTVYWYDSAEFAAHAAALGVPHPPGYPLYTLIAHVFTWLPGEAAWGVNAMSVVFGVLSCVGVYLLARVLGCVPWASAGAAALLATGVTFWGNAVVAEVYTPGLAFTVGVWLLLWLAERRRHIGWEVGGGLLAGLGVGVHLSIATVGLAYAWLVLTRPEAEGSRPSLQTRVRRAGAAIGGVLIGLTVFLYIPWRTFETWSDREWRRFFANAAGGAFRRKFHRADIFDRSVTMLDIFAENVQWVGLALALWGWIAIMRTHRRWGIAILLGVAGNVGTFFNYHVPDLDVFVLPSIALACVLAGRGAQDITRVWCSSGGGMQTRQGEASGPPEKPRRRYAPWIALAFMILPAYHLLRNYERCDFSQRTEAAEYARAVCESAREPAWVISYSSPAEWRRYAVFLYVQKALGQCSGVRVLVKPKEAQVQALLTRSRARVYAFLPLARFQPWDIRMEREGVLWRLRPVSGRRT